MRCLFTLVRPTYQPPQFEINTFSADLERPIPKKEEIRGKKKKKKERDREREKKKNFQFYRIINVKEIGENRKFLKKLYTFLFLRDSNEKTENF